MQLAVESLGERELFVVGERLIAEHEDGVFVHPCPYLSQRLAIVNLAKIDLAHLGDEVPVKLSECQGHARTFLPQITRQQPMAFCEGCQSDEGERCPQLRAVPNAGITSRANHASCSSMTALGVPI